MPRRRPGDSDDGPSRSGAGDARSVRAAQDAVGEVAQAGRVRDSGTAGSSAPGQAPRNDGLITRVTGEPGGTPAGRPTRIEPSQDDEVNNRWRWRIRVPRSWPTTVTG